MDTIIFIIIWVVLGIHSAWYLVRSITYEEEVTYSDIPMILFCLACPLVTHLATFITYGGNKDKILFKKRNL